MPKKEATPETSINITFQLKGEKAEKFLKYMEHEHIEINSVAAKKLTLERLDQVMAQAPEPALV